MLEVLYRLANLRNVRYRTEFDELCSALLQRFIVLSTSTVKFFIVTLMRRIRFHIPVSLPLLRAELNLRLLYPVIELDSVCPR